MTPDTDKWVHVRRPAKVIRLKMEPIEPPTAPVVDVPLIHVRRPAKVIRLTMEPVEPVALHLTLTLRPDTDAATVSRLFDKLTALVGLLGEMEADYGGAGLHIDAAASGPRPGPAVGLVLVPNDQTGAADRLRTLARLLTTAASDYPGKVAVVAKIVTVAGSGRTLYETAA